MKKRRWWLVGALVLSLALAWWRWVAMSPDSAPPPVVAVSEVELSEEAGLETPAIPAEPQQDDDQSPEFNVLEQFKQSTRYPPMTRKIGQDSHDLLNPGARYEQRHKLPGDKNNPDLDWEVLYTADRYFVREKEPVLVSLQLWNKGTKVLPVQVTMFAETIAVSENMQPVRLLTRVDGAARTAVFKPNDFWPDYAGQVRVTTEFSAEGLKKQVGSLDFFFTGATRIPAVFTGKIGDRLDNGDLVFDIEVDVKTAGNYRIDGSLFDSSGMPFGWARFEGTLIKGRVFITLRYYGLLFHDTQAVGPYMLQNLHGARLRPGDIPHKEDMPEFATDKVSTAFYELNRFRSDVNASPRRQRMIEMYEDAERRGVKLTVPAYTGDG